MWSCYQQDELDLNYLCFMFIENYRKKTQTMAGAGGGGIYPTNSPVEKDLRVKSFGVAIKRWKYLQLFIGV